MLRSMYSGVAGLKVHQTRMDVIGNNIANVNTTAYKYQAINFSDVMYQTSQHASGATQTTGGVNARQVGLGAIQAAISTAIEQQGATQTTNNPFDMRISGQSFFVVNDGSGPKYTRDGSFYIDGQGNLATSANGYYVLGWGTQKDEKTGGLTVNKNAGIGKMSLMTADNLTYEAEATAAGTFSGNIDKNDVDVASSEGKMIQYEFYDNKGYTYTAKFTLKQVVDAAGEPIAGEYTMQLKDITTAKTSAEKGTQQVSIRQFETGTGDDYYKTLKDMGITFGNTVDGAGAAINADGDTIHLKFNTRTGALESIDGYPKTTDGDKWKAALFHFNSDAGAQTPGNTTSGTAAPAEIVSNVTAMVTAMGADTETTSADKTRIISMDFSPVTNNNTNSQATIKVAKGNTSGNLTGRQVGALNGLQVGKDGKVTATYTNGQTRLMGQIAVAQFANASGLEKEGNNLYSATLNSGEAKVMDVSEDGGSITTGVLEMSNVDLSNEFTSMITAQRGFQANSRIITVSDTLLEELVNLKR